MIILLWSHECVEGEVITVLAESRYKMKWTMDLTYRDRVTTVNADEVCKKS